MKTIIPFIILLFILNSCKNNKHEVPSVKIYAPTLASIRQHETPEWFHDAKFGMFINWGLYSVAGWGPKRDDNQAVYPDWYLKRMYETEEWIEYHHKTWGKDFQRDDFFPMFTVENYDPEALVQVAIDAGMKYVIPFCKHHDGFCLWPSSYTDRDAMTMGPKRDLIIPLVEACRENDLKFGFYFSTEEWEYPILENGVISKIRLWGLGSQGGLSTHPYDHEKYKGMITGKKPVEDYYGDYILPQGKEFIDMYDPDILWFDGEWHTPVEEKRTPELVSYFYNQAAGRKEVAVNDRLGRSLRFQVGDIFTSEFHSLQRERSDYAKFLHKWEENRGISQSFGYNWQDTDENVLSAKDFIDMFVQIVSENGNLLLIVNLDGKGALPEIQSDRLREIGKWLGVNGEAIYGSRPWLVPNEGEKIRFTKSKDGRFAYIICTECPEKELKIQSVFPGEEAEIKMLGTNTRLNWHLEPVNRGKLVIEIPESIYFDRPCEHAWVFRVALI